MRHAWFLVLPALAVLAWIFSVGLEAVGSHDAPPAAEMAAREPRGAGEVPPLGSIGAVPARPLAGAPAARPAGRAAEATLPLAPAASPAAPTAADDGAAARAGALQPGQLAAAGNAAAARTLEAGENDRSAPLFFSSSVPDARVLLAPGTERFAPDTPRIYAAFDAGQPNLARRRQVLARWRDSAGKVLVVVPVALPEGARLGLSQLEGRMWSPGLHNVEIFGAEEGLPLLASGSFDVAVVPQRMELALIGSGPDGTLRGGLRRDEGVAVRARYASGSERTLDVVIRSADGGKPFRMTVLRLPAATAGVVWLTLKYAGEIWPAGRYLVEVRDGSDFVADLSFVQRD